MKAAILEGRRKLKIRELPLPRCGDDEAIIRVEACGICRTDLKCYEDGQRDLTLPRILGHELAGTVYVAGKKVKGVQPGMRVQVAPGLSCGACRYCRQGRDNLCHELKIVGFNYDGGFAQYMVVPARGLERGILKEIAPSLSFAEASLTEPLACCIHMQEALGLAPGESILISGCGRLGILNAKLAMLRGAEKVILLEPAEQRRELASRLGMFYCLDGANANVVEEIRRLTGGQGVDLAIPCCPDPAALETSLQALAKGGRLGFFSGLLPEKLPLNFNLIHYKEITVIGGYGCTLKDNRAALDLLASGAIEVKEILTREISLEEVEAGLSMIREMAALSVIITFN